MSSSLSQRRTAQQQQESAAAPSSPLMSPNAQEGNKRVFAPLSVPMERRKQTMAIAGWLSLFFGSIGLLFVIAGVWLYLVVAAALGCWRVFNAVYEGSAVYYASDADRAALAPRIADHVDAHLVIVVAEALILTLIIAAVALRRSRMKWPVAHRRQFPFMPFSTEHEFCTDAGVFHKWWARLYVYWSHWLTAYFPHRLIFDDESLDAEGIRALFPTGKNYIFACHPHGMASVSFWSSFCWRPTISEDPAVRASAAFHNADTPMRRFMEKYVVYGLDFGARVAAKSEAALAAHRQKAYGLVVHTLDLNFVQPFWRELVLRVGLRDVCRRAILNSIGPNAADATFAEGAEVDEEAMKRRRESGHLSRISCIVVGGAAESIDHNRPALLTLKKRKGFIRMCVETGSCVVPVYAFGENHLYGGAEPVVTKKGKVVDHWTVRLNRRSQKLLGFALPLALGRGVFNYCLGIVPHRRPLVTVVGRPIAVRQCPRPKKGAADYAVLQAAFDAEVDRAHEAYVASLSALYKRHQPTLDPDCAAKELQLR